VPIGDFSFTVGVLPKLLETLIELETLPDWVVAHPATVELDEVQPVSDAATAASRAVDATMVAILRTKNTFQTDKVSL
jgi:hypothetical protein